MNVSSCVYSQFSVVVKECDETCHPGSNEYFEFVTL